MTKKSQYDYVGSTHHYKKRQAKPQATSGGFSEAVVGMSMVLIAIGMLANCAG